MGGERVESSIENSADEMNWRPFFVGEGDRSGSLQTSRPHPTREETRRDGSDRKREPHEGAAEPVKRSLVER